MYKAILFDIDGVLIRLPKYYSDELERLGYRNASARIMEYYKTDAPCSEGKADPLETIAPYLASFGWKGTAEEYFREQFEFERAYVDESLMASIQRLRAGGYACYLATDQNHHRKAFLLDGLGFRESFDGRFVSCELGYRKVMREYWGKALAVLRSTFPNIRPEDILYFDDRAGNLDVARSFGIDCFHVSGEDRIQEMKALVGRLAEGNATRPLAGLYAP